MPSFCSWESGFLYPYHHQRPRFLHIKSHQVIHILWATMPRAKVRPQDRQRSMQACVLCKTLKIRCDSQTPCLSCVNRSRASSCRYVPPKSRYSASLDGGHKRARRSSPDSNVLATPESAPHGAPHGPHPSDASLQCFPATPKSSSGSGTDHVSQIDRRDSCVVRGSTGEKGSCAPGP